MRVQLVCILSLIKVSLSLSIDPNDILNGVFLPINSLMSSVNVSHDYSLHVVSNANQPYFTLEKISSQPSFDQYVSYSFQQSHPTHLSFTFAADSTEKESVNLRLIDSSSSVNSTMLLFRAGRAGLVRVNANQMVDFYNNSIIENGATGQVSFKVDMLLDWASQSIDIYCNGVFKGKTSFLNDVKSVDQIRLYNLQQSTSYWKGLVLCSPVCYSFSFSPSMPLSFLMIIILLLSI